MMFITLINSININNYNINQLLDHVIKVRQSLQKFANHMWVIYKSLQYCLLIFSLLLTLLI